MPGCLRLSVAMVSSLGWTLLLLRAERYPGRMVTVKIPGGVNSRIACSAIGAGASREVHATHRCFCLLTRRKAGSVLLLSPDRAATWQRMRRLRKIGFLG